MKKQSILCSLLLGVTVAALTINTKMCFVKASESVSQASEEIHFVPMGEYSILNNELNVIDYKVTNEEQINQINDYIFQNCNKVNKTTTTVGEQDFSEIQNNQYLSYLVEHNIISRRVSINLATGDNRLTLSSPLDANNNAASSVTSGDVLMSKSDLYMALYKICYGVELSNPIALRYVKVPAVPTENDAYKIAENTYVYYPDGGVTYYQSPNVYEIYLTNLLEKGLISKNELSLNGVDVLNQENNFETIYNVIQKGSGGFSGANFMPTWYNYSLKDSWKDLLATNKSSLEALLISPDFMGDSKYSLYRKYLGNSVDVSRYSDSFGCIQEYYVTSKNNEAELGHYKNIGYFAKEKMTVSDALKIIEKMVRATEKEMTRIEAELINYKYGVTVLDSMTDEEKNTVSFLIAKGILNFDDKDANSDKELYSDLSASFRWEDSWKLLYRVANKAARYDFNNLQLTDSESFWQERGYAENEISLYEEDSVPYIDVISATKVKENADGSLEILEDQESGEGDLEFLDDEAEDDSDDSKENLITKLLQKASDLFVTETYATGNTSEALSVGNTCYEVRIILANQYEGVDVQYKYGDEVLTPTSLGVIEDLVGYNNTDYPGYTIYTFKINASTRNRAIALLHARLKTSSLKEPIGSMMGVTTMTNSSTGKTTTLISKDALTKNLTEIKVVNNNTLMNTETGVLVTMLPNQESLGGRSIAFCGNKVIICDDMIVTDNTSQIYYNLEVICSILPNATLKKINGAASLVRTGISSESPYQIVDSDSNVLENNYVATFGKFKNSKGEASLFYNLDSATRSVNCIERTWDLQVKDTTGRVQNSKLTLVVEWKYSVPTQAAAGSSILLKEDSSEDFTLEDVNTFLNTRPSSEALSYYWDRNLGMSNALAQMIYGDTKNTQYVTCGYLVPSVYVLSTGGAGLKNGNVGSDKEAVFVSKTSLSYSQLNQFFKKLNLSQKYLNTYFGGDKANWWESFYTNIPCKESKDNPANCTGTSCTNYYVHNLMSKENCFKVYTPCTVSVQTDGSSSVFYAFGAKADGDSYKNARFILAQGDTLYRSISNDSKCTLIQKASGEDPGILKIKTKSDNVMVTPNRMDSVLLEESGVTLSYLGTESLNNVGVYRFVLSDVGANSNLSTTFKCHFTGKKSTDLTALANYVNSEGMTPGDYAKKVSTVLNSFYLQPPDATYFAWNDMYYKELENIKYVATWERYKSQRIGGKIQSVTNLKDGTFRSRTTLDESRFGDVNSKNVISVIVPVFFKTNDCYITQEGGVLKLKRGSGLGALNSSIYYVGLNGLIRDKLLAQDVNSIRVNKLDQGDTIYINGKKFVMTSDGYLQSTLQLAQPDTAGKIAKQYVESQNVNSLEVKSAILQTFNGYGIHTGGRVYSFATFVNDVKLSNLDSAVKKAQGILCQQVYRKGKKAYCYVKGSAVGLTSATLANCNPSAFKFSMKVSDELICRPLNEIGTVYELIQVTDAYAGIGMGNLPFVLTDALDTEESKTVLSFSSTGFSVTAFTKEIKTQFINDYKQLLQGDIWSFCRLIGIHVLCYLMVVTLFATVMLRMPIVKNILLALAHADGRRAKGVDLVKIFTLGVYSVNDEPVISKLIIMDILFTIIMYFLLNGFG